MLVGEALGQGIGAVIGSVLSVPVVALTLWGFAALYYNEYGKKRKK